MPVRHRQPDPGELRMSTERRLAHRVERVLHGGAVVRRERGEERPADGFPRRSRALRGVRPDRGQRGRENAVVRLRERRVPVAAETGEGGACALQDEQVAQARLDRRPFSPARDPGRAPIRARPFERRGIEAVPEPLLYRDLDRRGRGIAFQEMLRERDADPLLPAQVLVEDDGAGGTRRFERRDVCGVPVPRQKFRGLVPRRNWASRRKNGIPPK